MKMQQSPIHEDQSPPLAADLVERVGVGTEENEGNWVTMRRDIARDYKAALAAYSTSHFLEYAVGMMFATGSTVNNWFDAVLNFQMKRSKAFDLKIASNNLNIFRKWRAARAKRIDIFRNTQMHLIGGSFLEAVDSYVGEFAVSGIHSDLFYPDVVAFSASTVQFDMDIRLGYQFEEELATQKAFATRATNHRVLLVDHTKLGKRAGWRMNVTLKEIVATASRFTILSTFPEESEASQQAVTEQVEAFERMLRMFYGQGEFIGKEVELRLINKRGEDRGHIALSKIRNDSNAPDDGLVFKRSGTLNGQRK